MVKYAIVLKALCIFTASRFAWASPSQQVLKVKHFDLQGHRGSRGETVESLLPAFAWGFIDGVATLELDNGITKDGVVIVWHDEVISSTKCNDTRPAFQNDPVYPYVGKAVVNLTLAQIKTLDCGSKRLADFPIATTYPGTKISTLSELFKFAQCVDTKREIEFNIESKINPVDPGATRGVDDFVRLQRAEFQKSGYKLAQITYQSFDWRTLVAMKMIEPTMTTAALIDRTTVFGEGNTTSPWLAGLRVQDFPGETTGQQIAHAAKSIGSNIVSPAAVESGTDPMQSNYVPFTTKEMIDQAHKLGMRIKPWTVNRHNIAGQLLDWGVDGIITDYPEMTRRLIASRGLVVPPKFSKKRVFECLNKHVQRV